MVGKIRPIELRKEQTWNRERCFSATRARDPRFSVMEISRYLCSYMDQKRELEIFHAHSTLSANPVVETSDAEKGYLSM